MSNPLSITTTTLFLLVAGTLIYVAYTFSRTTPKQTSLVFYAHDSFTGPDACDIVVAGKNGPGSNISHFGTLAAFDDPVTEGPDRGSKEIGRAQGFFINSALDGKAWHMVFSVIFTNGQYKGSTLEIQGADLFSMKKHEFSVVSGTGYFRFVKGYGIYETELFDLPSMTTIAKLTVTVKHY